MKIQKTAYPFWRAASVVMPWCLLVLIAWMGATPIKDIIFQGQAGSNLNMGGYSVNNASNVTALKFYGDGANLTNVSGGGGTHTTNNVYTWELKATNTPAFGQAYGYAATNGLGFWFTPSGGGGGGTVKPAEPWIRLWAEDDATVIRLAGADKLPNGDYVGGTIPLYQSGAWVERTGVNVTLNISALTAGVYDAWAYNNAGTVTLTVNPASSFSPFTMLTKWANQSGTHGNTAYDESNVGWTAAPHADGVLVYADMPTFGGSAVLNRTYRYVGSFKTTTDGGSGYLVKNDRYRRHIWSAHHRKPVISKAFNSSGTTHDFSIPGWSNYGDVYGGTATLGVNAVEILTGFIDPSDRVTAQMFSHAKSTATEFTASLGVGFNDLSLDSYDINTVTGEAAVMGTGADGPFPGTGAGITATYDGPWPVNVVQNGINQVDMMHLGDDGPSDSDTTTWYDGIDVYTGKGTGMIVITNQ